MARLALQLKTLLRLAFAAILSLLLGPGELGQVRTLLEGRAVVAHVAGSEASAGGAAIDRDGRRLKAHESRRAAKSATDRRDGPSLGDDPLQASRPRARLVLAAPTRSARRAIAHASRDRGQHRPRAPPIGA